MRAEICGRGAKHSTFQKSAARGRYHATAFLLYKSAITEMTQNATAKASFEILQFKHDEITDEIVERGKQ